MIRYIDKEPPAQSGDVKQDIAALYNYITYLQEQVNFIIAQIKKEV